MKKRFISLFLVFIFINLIAEVNFELIFEMDYPENNPILDAIQMFDINDDGLLEIVLIFKYDHSLVFRCYDTVGNYLLERSISGNNFSKPAGNLIKYNNELLIISEFENCESIQPFELMIKIQEFHNSVFVDSLIIYPDDMFSSTSSNTRGDIKAFIHNDDLIILAGCSHKYVMGGLESSIFKFVYDNELCYEQYFTDCGDVIFDFTGSDFIFTTGYKSAVMGGGLHRYLKYISKSDYSTTGLIYSAYGWYDDDIWCFIHYPKQFNILNQNDLNYQDYGLLIQELIIDQDSCFAHFRNYYPNSTVLNWSNNSVLDNSDMIISSTCVNVNDEDNFVMYFRDNILEIRNRINGGLVHSQISNIIPNFIRRDNSNNLLFFVEDQDINVFALADDINVNVIDSQIPIDECIISNFPNPFNPETTIKFSIQNDSKVELLIYNIKGQKIKTLIQSEFTQGSHSVTWKGVDESRKPVSSGIYYYKLKVNGNTEAVKKCLLLK
jgi:FlgD Ig-like domain